MCKSTMTYVISGQDYLFLPILTVRTVIFTWIPCHVGIHRNTVVDKEAKNALDDPVSNCSIPYNYFRPLIMEYILKHWQGSWDQQILL
jgi:hypothetical protein